MKDICLINNSENMLPETGGQKVKQWPSSNQQRSTFLPSRSKGPFKPVEY